MGMDDHSGGQTGKYCREQIVHIRTEHCDMGAINKKNISCFQFLKNFYGNTLPLWPRNFAAYFINLTSWLRINPMQFRF